MKKMILAAVAALFTAVTPFAAQSVMGQQTPTAAACCCGDKCTCEKCSCGSASCCGDNCECAACAEKGCCPTKG